MTEMHGLLYYCFLSYSPIGSWLPCGHVYGVEGNSWTKNYISLSFFLSYGKATDTLYQQVGLRNSAYCRTCIGHVSRDLHFEYCNCSSIDLRLRN